MALYEKGCLRKDVEALLHTAKEKGLYTFCVNNSRLQKYEIEKDLIDCYIERFNFGRDFGSYQVGFKHLFSRGWDQKCPRLLLMNDSVFYSKKNLSEFLENLIQSEKEVLGATENHERHHHIGSFCIAMGQRILQHPVFKKFWRNYSNSDIRPKVIDQGEIALSKTLRNCTTSPENYSVLFNQTWLSEHLGKHPEILMQASDYYRSSTRVGWKRPSLQTVYQNLKTKYFFTQHILYFIQGTLTFS